MKIHIALILLAVNSFTSAQQFMIRGTVNDKQSGAPLPYANILIIDRHTGTAANKNGLYEFKLKPGRYSLVASYIGYNSDTINVDLNANKYNMNFMLAPSEIFLEEIIVRPGVNPAVAIIRKAIERKKVREGLLNSYELEAYTKGIIRTNQEISARERGINLSAGNDTAALFISGIIENQSRGYFKKPDKFKEIITARKQSANLPSSINILTGGRFIQNFYEDNIFFLGNELKGPLADGALDYYYYYIEGMDAINKTRVYKIHVGPDNSSDPGFTGDLYITDSTYDLIKIDLQLNRAANPGGIFDTINVYQQFNEYDDIYMPSDYRLYAAGNVLGIAKFGFELNTILYDYKINEHQDDNFFDKAVITVIPEADGRDSSFWNSIQSIPNTDEEHAAYNRIDSLNKIPVSFWDEFSFLSTRINLSNNFSVSGPLSLYHFNRVEGHSLDFGVFADDFFKERLSSDVQFNYGFADKRFKYDFNSVYRFGKYRTGKVELNLYNKTKVIFGESINYAEFTSTFLALVSKYEFRDYYYCNGAAIKISDEIFPVFRIYGGYEYIKDLSARKNTDFSFFKRKQPFKENIPVADAELNILSAGFRMDFRDYIEDGLYRSRISEGNSFIIINGTVRASDKNIIPSSSNFIIFDAELEGEIRSFRSTSLDYNLYGMYTRGNLPYQMFYSVAGNINYTVNNNTFRTLNVNEAAGDRVATANIEYNFRDELFRMLKIPQFRYSEIQFKVFMNSAISYISHMPNLINGYKFQQFKSPFYETGFSVGHILFPIELSFAWKLNYRGNNNFRFAIGTIIY